MTLVHFFDGPVYKRQNKGVTRRRLVHLLAYASALPGGAEFIVQWLRAGSREGQHSGGNTPPPEPDLWHNYQPRFFSPEDFEALAALTEILIPTDETPGAREAHCAQFIDFLLVSSGGYAPELQKRWTGALAQWKQAGFHAADAAGRAALVAEVAAAERGAGGKRHPAFAAYLLVKRENAFAFYTSRAGMIGALDYRGNSYNATFPPCTHPEHHVV